MITDEAFRDDRVTDFIAWLRDKLKEIPAAHRKRARISTDSTSDYGDSHSAQIEIYYDCR